MTTSEKGVGLSVGDALERAARLCEEQAEIFLSPEYATGQPLSSLNERIACKACASAIRDYAAAISKATAQPLEGEG